MAWRARADGANELSRQRRLIGWLVLVLGAVSSHLSCAAIASRPGAWPPDVSKRWPCSGSSGHSIGVPAASFISARARERPHRALAIAIS